VQAWIAVAIAAQGQWRPRHLAWTLPGEVARRQRQEEAELESEPGPKAASREWQVVMVVQVLGLARAVEPKRQESFAGSVAVQEVQWAAGRKRREGLEGNRVQEVDTSPGEDRTAYRSLVGHLGQGNHVDLLEEGNDHSAGGAEVDIRRGRKEEVAGLAIAGSGVAGNPAAGLGEVEDLEGRLEHLEVLQPVKSAYQHVLT